ncbi:hypothetical protein [Streptomyces sp. NPDC056227]|uniref:hypothetical protein n=1 Tax=Streptomyces sp. NPDC056227 TaxID=3345753 RepID=UPI0035DBE4EE
MTIRYRRGETAELGGLDIIICLTPQEADAFQAEVVSLADSIDSLLYALVLLRTGRTTRTKLRTTSTTERDATLTDLHVVLADLDAGLLPRIQGARDALIRLHKQMGGSLAQLAAVMEVSKSTAQSRRTAITSAPMGQWEKWAVAEDANSFSPGGNGA